MTTNDSTEVATQPAESKFAAPAEIDAVTAAFPASVRDLMPAYPDVPEAFRNGRTKWNKFQSDWFYFGIDVSGLIAKEGIDRKKALRHLGTIQGSFEPKHEHKEAAVAYLASLWFDDASTWAPKERAK